MQSTRKAVGILSVAAACAIGAPVARAADWQFAPRILFGAEYDDNFTLDEIPGQEIEVQGGRVDATLGMLARTPTSELEFRPRVHATYYPDESEHDSVDGYADIDYSKRGLRSTFGVLATYSHVSVVRSDLPDTDFDPDLGEVGGADTGRFFVRSRRDLLQLRPSASFELTERTDIELGARYLDVSYDRTVPGGQTGYRDVSATIGLSRDVTPLSTIALSTTASQYEPDAIGGRDSNSYSVQLRWTKRLSETQSYYVAGGGTRTEFDAVAATSTPSQSSTTFLAGLGTRWAFQLTDIYVDLSHQVVPSATGTVQERDEARLRLVRRITPTVSALGAARYAQLDSETAAGISNDRKYGAASVGLEWRIRRQWALEATYDYRWRKDDDEPTDAGANGVFLGAVYEPRRLD